MKRFSGADVWATLTKDSQDRIGAIAIEWVYATIAVGSDDRDELDVPETPCRRAITTACDQLDADLVMLAGDLMPDVAWTVEDEGVDSMAVPSALGRVCRVCGCSDNDPCPGGCAWVEDDLCSSPACNPTTN